MLTLQSESFRHQVEPVIFPDGTSQVFLPPGIHTSDRDLELVWTFEKERELIDVAALATGLKRKSLTLVLPYLPYARQDKEVTLDKPSTYNLHTFALLINSLKFDNIKIFEPHNRSLTEQLFHNCIIAKIVFPKWLHEGTLIVFPDNGAHTRYSEQFVDHPCAISFNKHRNPSDGIIGQMYLSETEIRRANKFLATGSMKIWIVDDLVDGGRTFTLCAEYLRKHLYLNTTEIDMYVAHAVLSENLPIPGISKCITHHGHTLSRQMKHNILLQTDVYKLFHHDQYPQGTEFVYSYMIARSDKKWRSTLFYGLQYYLLEYLTGRLTQTMVMEFLQIHDKVLGKHTDAMKKRLMALSDLGYLPLRIKAVPEGTIVETRNVLVTITNTEPGYGWLVGYIESLLLKIWNTCTVATFSYEMKKLCTGYGQATCDNNDHVPFQIHDFGYRGCSSEETAALGGSAHLLNFQGTDTLPAVKLVNDYYGRFNTPFASSVPGTEHSVMCAYGREGEFDAFQRMLKVYPTGPVAIVSDSYDFWHVLRDFLPKLKDQILARDGKLIIRPDSGNPEDILLGSITGNTEEEKLGALRVLDKIFGSEVNSKGFKVLNPKIGLVYGDGMYFERINRIFERLKEMGYASSNIVFGVGGLLLQSHNRDEQSFAFKATSITVNGKLRAIYKAPLTDAKKASHKGLLKLERQWGGGYVTKDNVSPQEENEGCLIDVFVNGQVVNRQTFDQIKDRIH